MYFLLAGIVHRFAYLKYGLALILTFVGIKMVIVDFYHVPIVVSLGVIMVTLSVSVSASLLFPPRPKELLEKIEGKTGSIFGTIPPGSEHHPE